VLLFGQEVLVAISLSLSDTHTTGQTIGGIKIPGEFEEDCVKAKEGESYRNQSEF
jgi:hypothetical protein